MKQKTLAIVGCGKLANIVVNALQRGLLPDYKLIATYSRTFEKAENLAQNIREIDPDMECMPCESLHDLLALRPDYLVETASPAALRELAISALENGSSIVTLSIGAFADAAFYETVRQTAAENNTRVYLASGAIGGFDVLRTASLMEDATVTFKTQKGPSSLKNTEIYEDALQTQQQVVFDGNAAEAIALFPTRVNVAVAAALATNGPENLKVSIESVPGFIGDDHRIELRGEQIHAVIDIYSKTAEIAGWSIVNVLRNITSPIVF